MFNVNNKNTTIMSVLESLFNKKETPTQSFGVFRVNFEHI